MGKDPAIISEQAVTAETSGAPADSQPPAVRSRVRRAFDWLIDIGHNRIIVGLGALLAVILPIWGAFLWVLDTADPDREALVRQAQATAATQAERQFAEERERLHGIIETQAAALAAVGQADKAGIADISKKRVDQALKLAADGKRGQALDILEEVAERAGAEAAAQHSAAAETYRQLGALASLDDIARALAAYRRAAELEPKDTWTWINIARLEQQKGNLSAAKKAAVKARAAALTAGDERDATVADSTLGDVAVAQGDLSAALESYQAGLSIRERLAAADAGNAGWQRDLSVSHDRIGDVLRAQGNLASALESYQAGLSIGERLAAADAGNAGWQRDLFVSLTRIGLTAEENSDREQAARAYRQGRDIIESLTALDPTNATWANDLSWVEGRLAALKEESG